MHSSNLVSSECLRCGFPSACDDIILILSYAVVDLVNVSSGFFCVLAMSSPLSLRHCSQCVSTIILKKIPLLRVPHKWPCLHGYDANHNQWHGYRVWWYCWCQCQRPSADTYIQKTRKLYLDTHTQRNLSKLNDDLIEVQQIMTRNIQEVLGMGEKLDRKSSCLWLRNVPCMLKCLPHFMLLWRHPSKKLSTSWTLQDGIL